MTDAVHTDPLVEFVAHVIAENRADWDTMTPEEHACYRQDAREVIEAIRQSGRLLPAGDQTPSVDLVAAVLGGSSLWGDYTEEHRDAWRAKAREVVASLSGRLLPEGGETRTEWRVRYVGLDGRTHHTPMRDEADADQAVAALARRGAHGHKEHRIVTTHNAPWEPVHD